MLASEVAGPDDGIASVEHRAAGGPSVIDDQPDPPAPDHWEGDNAWLTRSRQARTNEEIPLVLDRTAPEKRIIKRDHSPATAATFKKSDQRRCGQTTAGRPAPFDQY
jgi:hypothetical protein